MNSLITMLAILLAVSATILGLAFTFLVYFAKANEADYAAHVEQDSTEDENNLRPQSPNNEA